MQIIFYSLFCAPIINTSCTWKHTKAHKHGVIHLSNDKTNLLSEDLPSHKTEEKNKGEETSRIPGKLFLSQHMLNKTLLSSRERGCLNITISPHSN